MGVGFPLAGLLLLIGLGTMFVSPWIGAAVLAAAAILGAVGMVGLGAKATAGDRTDEPAEAPHLPGPGNPESGVD